MIFNGTDSLVGANGDGLWLTDGTAGGTKEVGGVSPGSPHPSPFTNGDPNGLSPGTIVSFGSKALFLGSDATGDTYLWVTDGTVGGTEEIGGLENGGIADKAVNLDPTNFAAFNNQILFDGYDSQGFQGLWISDGTTAGTMELGGFVKNQGVAHSGLSNFDANDFITLGDKVLFNAEDAAGASALWISDGTGGGTGEIGGLSNAGVVGASQGGFGDGLAQAVVFGDRVFFAGPDSEGTGLWATDGTTAGTTEIGGLSDAGLTSFGQSPSSLGLAPTDLTVNGMQLLFNGVDSIGENELWVSDGTALSTTEVGGLADALLSNVAVNGLNPQQITSLGNGKAVFIGYDDSNNSNPGKATLWVTDGTTAGTEEIGGVDNQGVANVYANGGLSPDDLMGSDGVAYFTGEDASGSYVLWETDGAVGGTHVVSASDGNAPTTGLLPYNMALGPEPKSDAAQPDLPQDLTKVSYSDNLVAQYNPATDTVKILDSANGYAVKATIALTGAVLAGALIKLASDGAGGTQVTLTNIPGMKEGTGDVVVSGVKGQAYIGYRSHYVGKLLMETDYFYAATGQPYQYYELDITGGNVLIGTKYYYDNVTGQNYTSYEADYDAGGKLSKLIYRGGQRPLLLL